nr:5'-AMP-activated protein kinase subunit beta-1 [Leptinotarsa decemlineata]
MGNAGSTGAPRERQHKLSEVIPCSPIKEGQAFVFDKKPEGKVQFQSLQEEEVPYFTKPITAREQPRPRSNTVSEGTQPSTSRATHTPTVFRWEGGGKNVYISGSFSNWQTIPMVKSYGDFVAIVDLPEVLKWENIKIKIEHVFQALAKDSENIKDDSQKEFGQEIPANKPWEKTSGPPILPPHLLQVILNKDTPLSCEPTLLPEPIHVMLNHLYALSIKDGVMVLSATHRYRKKYVTTLLYKPI